MRRALHEKEHLGLEFFSADYCQVFVSARHIYILSSVLLHEGTASSSEYMRTKSIIFQAQRNIYTHQL
jgi:hypothetical protein